MNCYYCKQDRRYFIFQNKISLCKKCLTSVNLNGFIIVKGENNLIDINQKYEFNTHYNSIIYFKFNIYKYIKDDQIRIGIDFVFDNINKRLFENVNFYQFNLKYPNDYSTIFPGEFLNYIDSFLNYDEYDKNTNNLIQTFDVNKVFQIMVNNESKEETYYFPIYNFLFYFDNYIKIVLKNAIEKILFDIDYDKNIPNFMAQKYKCDTTFKIVIPDLLNDEELWEEKINEYLLRDEKLEEKRPGRQQEMMSRPPSSYITYPNYFHFILTNNDETQIIGYCVCHVVSMNYIKNTKSSKFFLQSMIPLFIKQETDNINFQLFQNYLKNNNTKTNLFYIDSLSVDKEYRGSDFAFSSFLIYHALLFALNAKELNIGIIGVQSAAKATEIIVEKFGFTNIHIKDEIIIKYEEIISKIELFINNPNITKEDKEIYNLNVIRFYDEEFEMNKNFEFENLDNYFEILVQSKSFSDLGYFYSFCFFIKKELEDTKKKSESIDLILNMFYNNHTITDLVYIDNPSFIQKMYSLGILMISCVEEINRKSNKRKLEGVEEEKRKKIKLKFVLSMDQINKIFI